MTDASFLVPVPGSVTLAGTRRGRPGAPAVVLLHAAVADRRSWDDVLDALAGDDLDLIAYDRRGFGDTPAGDVPFTDLDDLRALLDAAGVDRALLVGNSMGGGLALDLAATEPERVAGLVLLAPGVSGMTDEGEDAPYVLDDASRVLFEAAGAAHDAGELDEEVRLLLHLWLDGPDQPEGRVGGDARALATAMNRRILEIGAPDDAGAGALDTWHGLAAVRVPAIVAWGDLDVPADLPWYERIAERLPLATARLLPGVAHLPSVERPELVADLIREALARR